MAQKSSRNGKWKATARTKTPWSNINRRLALDPDRTEGFISGHICGLIRINNVWGIKDERAWDLFNDIIFLDPVTTRHFSQFQLMWPHCRSRSSPFQKWWAAFPHIWGKCLTKPVTKWTIGGGTTTVLLGIKSIGPIRRKPARERLNAPASISPGMVVMISGQRLSHQAAGSTSQATSWPLDHWIGMRWSTRMMRMRTGRIPERGVVDGAIMALTMTMTTARVRRTCRVVRKGPGKGRKQRMGRGKGRQLRTGRGKGRGRGSETIQGKVLRNKPQGEMIYLALLLCSCRREYQRQTWTQRAN